MPNNYIDGLIGGMLIGLAAVILFWYNGRVMGVSGIASRLFEKKNLDTWWRLMFVLGLIAGGIIYRLNVPVTITIDGSIGLIIVAGLLVGFGTVIGNGCTSGHGICGNARLSKRSMVATLVFMAAGMMTVLIKRMLGGG